MQRVRLHDLAVVQEARQLLRGRRQWAEAGDDVHCLGRRDEVADRADTAQALHGDRDLPVGPALDEDLETTELDDMEPDLMNPVLLIEENRHLAVSLDARDRLDGHTAQLMRRLGGFQIERARALNRNA